MMRQNLQLLDSIYGSDKGLRMQGRIVHYLRNIIKEHKVLFVGYVQPYVEIFRNCDVYYVIPTEYNSQLIPLSKKNILVEGHKFPFPDKYFDVVVVAHLLEFSRYSVEFLKEFYRVLEGQGTIANISFNKCMRQKKCRSADKIIDLLMEDDKFRINKIVGIDREFSAWPYNFSLDVSKYNEFLLDIIPFLSDVVFINAVKVEPETIPLFVPNYGIANG